MRRSSHATLYVLVAIFLLILAVALFRARPLVVLNSDHPNQTPLFVGVDLGPGQSTTVTDTLSNQGLLVLTYSLEVTSQDGTPIPPGYRVQIRRLPDRVLLYSGPLPRSSGPLGNLSPGQTVSLELTLSLSRDSARGQLPANLSWKWRGQAGLSSSWLLPLFELFLGLAVLAIVARWLVESRMAREEHGWSREPAAREKSGLDLSRRPGP